MRQSGAALAATNYLSAGSACKRRDAVALGTNKGLQPRANERPADSFSFKLGRRRSWPEIGPVLLPTKSRQTTQLRGTFVVHV